MQTADVEDSDSDVDQSGNVMSAYFLRPSSKDSEHPEYGNPAILRPEWENKHKHAQNYEFFYRPRMMRPETLHNRFSLEILHKSCNKACALYCIPEPPQNPTKFLDDLFRAVYDVWFVPNESYILYGAFVAQLFGCWDKESPKEVESILDMHKEFCAQVKSRHRILDEIDSLRPSSDHAVKYHSKFELLPLFRAVVIILDKEDWRKEGVLLVRTSDEEGLSKWPINEGASPKSRLRLEEAVRVVLQMQRSTENDDEKALRLAPVVNIMRDIRLRQ